MQEASVAPGQVGTFEFTIKAPNAPGTYNERYDLVAEGAAWMNDAGLNFHITVVAPNWSWQPVGQFAYSDQNMTTGKGTTGLLPGDRVYVGFQARNVGNMTWHNSGAGTVRVGTTGPLDRASRVADASWIGPSRPAVMTENTVAPGQVGTFKFWVDAPPVGNYAEHFSLVAEGVSWMNDPGLNFYVTSAPATFSWEPVGQYAYSDQTMTTGKGTVGLHTGDRVYVGFQARNMGNMTWHNSGAGTIRVGTTGPLDRASRVADPSWIGPSRPAAMTENSVAPGQIGTFGFWVDAPQVGNYLEHFSLVAEGVAWMNDPGLSFHITVVP
jgi:hypothetical protein